MCSLFLLELWLGSKVWVFVVSSYRGEVQGVVASAAGVEMVGDLRAWHQGYCDWSDRVSSVDTTRA